MNTTDITTTAYDATTGQTTVKAAAAIRLAPSYADLDLDAAADRYRRLREGANVAAEARRAAEKAVELAVAADRSAAADALRTGAKPPKPTVTAARADLEAATEAAAVADLAVAREGADLIAHVGSRPELLAAAEAERADARQAVLDAVAAVEAADERLRHADAMLAHLSGFPRSYAPARHAMVPGLDHPRKLSTVLDAVRSIAD